MATTAQKFKTFFMKNSIIFMEIEHFKMSHKKSNSTPCGVILLAMHL
jgi:hypothetical protein